MVRFIGFHLTKFVYKTCATLISFDITGLLADESAMCDYECFFEFSNFENAPFGTIVPKALNKAAPPVAALTYLPLQRNLCRRQIDG